MNPSSLISLLILIGVVGFMVYASFVQRKAAVSQQLYQENQQQSKDRSLRSMVLLEESIALQREMNGLLREISAKIDKG